MVLLYDFIFLVFALLTLPIYALKRKIHKGFTQRLGFIKTHFKSRPIWVHTVSVGEARACQQLIEGLRKAYPTRPIAISTVTSTGNKIARTLAKEGDFVFYLPLDFSFIVRYVVNTINPVLFVIAETEIWPNLISYLHMRNIPVVAVNARISDSSFRGYSLIKSLIKPVLNKISWFCVQTETDAARLFSLGGRKEEVKVTGNMKYDYADYEKKDYAEYKMGLGLESKDKLFVAGSTHAGEEKIILNVYKELSEEFANLRLLIAPRHPERALEIERLVSKFDLRRCLLSEIEATKINKPRAAPATSYGGNHEPRMVFILDTIGQLIPFYAIADIVFVGGSLIKKGGHNILEPAFFEKPILVGPHTFNFRDIMSTFTQANAVVVVRDAHELRDKVKFLLTNAEEADNLGRRAKELLVKNGGATQKNIECIRALLKEGSFAK